MGKFITGKELEEAVYNIIWEAENTLMIVSPYIKLDDYFKELFNKHKNNPHIHLKIIFGKNESEVKKSMSMDDFEFFKNFLNVSIIHAPNLHAKYYGNEKMGVITSINLYDYSFKNNIEFGVFSKQSIFNKFTQNADNDAWNECYELAEKSDVVFIKRPIYQTKKILVNLGKTFVKSEVLHDNTDFFYSYRGRLNQKDNVLLSEFPSELELGSLKTERPDREVIKKETKPRFNKIEKAVKTPIQTKGYCIRRGVEISYNPNRPFSDAAWETWQQFRNSDYPENYCHKTGEKSFGNTSKRNPILEKNIEID